MKEEAAKDLLRRSEEARKSGLEALQVRRQEMRENTAYYRGLHWSPESDPMDLDPAMDSVDNRERNDTFNRCRPLAVAYASSMFRSGPNFRIEPSGTTTISRMQAKMSDAQVRAMYRNGIIDPKELYDAALDSSIKGIAWLRGRWNPRGGKWRDDVVLKKDSDDPERDAFGEERYERSWEGEVEVQFHTGLNVIPDPALRWADSRWVHLVTWEPRSKLEAWFPEDAMGEPTKGRWRLRSQQDGSEMTPDTDESRGHGDHEQCEWVEWWVKPGVFEEYPRGMFLCSSGEMLVHCGPLPYRFYPWRPVYGPNPNPNSMFSDGIIADQKSAQSALNEAWTKEREIWDNYAPQILNAKDNGIADTDFSNVPGTVLSWDATKPKPEPFEPAKPPPELAGYREVLRDAMDDLSTQTSISRGQNDPNVKSAKQARTLYAFQASAHAPMFVMWDQALADLAKICLGIAYDYYEPGRLISLAAQHGQSFSDVFDPAIFDPNVNIVVDPYSDRPVTRSERIQEGSELMAAGGFEDTVPAQRFREYVQLDADGVGPTEDIMSERAMAKVIRLAAGHPLPTQPWEPHEQVLRHINLFRNTAEFDLLPPEIQENVSRAADEHEEILFAQMQEQQMMGGGQAEEPGRASPPKPPGPDDAGGRPSGPVQDLLQQVEAVEP